jgi:hypothetical protein
MFVEDWLKNKSPKIRQGFRESKETEINRIRDLHD